jgi:Ca2+-binding RTX toxin-like protein
MTSRVFTSDTNVTSGNIADLAAEEYAYVKVGVVISNTGALATGASGYGIMAPQFDNTIDIFGTVLATGSALVLGTASSTTNFSIVNIGPSAELKGYNLAGIELYGNGATITNNGHIYGFLNGIALRTGSIFTTGTHITNTGDIESFNAAAIAHDGGDSPVLEVTTLTNSGTIRAANGWQSYRQFGNDSVDVIVNSGKMLGAVDLNGGNDSIDTTKGTVQGDIDLGAGSDTAYGSAAADNIQGGTENDVIRGNGGKDNLDGGDGTQDYIDFSDKTTKVEITLLAPGVSGTAKVNGVVEDTFKNFEAVVGGSAGDLLTGNFGSNNISGGKGNDTAIGASGNDSIFGGDGNYLIAGGLGNDQLTGNAGADLFRFNSTLSTAANVDTITDFTHASDEIQLDDAIFTALTSPWSSAQFKSSASGHVANTTNQHILYDQSTGVLWYDPDGSGAGGQTAFAKLGTGTHSTIDWTDFAIT